MIKYNWELLYKYCDFNKIVTIDYLLYARGFTIKPPLRKLKSLKRCIPEGESYILDIDSLLLDKSASKYDKFQYLELCSKRNPISYMFFGDVSLQKVFATKENTKYNTLITQKENKLYFKYEDIALEKLKDVKL
jgi:hypothetical protein